VCGKFGGGVPSTAGLANNMSSTKALMAILDIISQAPIKANLKKAGVRTEIQKSTEKARRVASLSSQ
jgi:hypothetical protein